MARTRQLVAPKGTGGLLSCALSPHDGGASLAVGGENAAALVFDLRGAHLVAHRLTAAAGCFDREDAVPCVSYNLAAPHALYCASGRVVTAWDVRRLPGAADARVRVGCVAGAAKSAPPTHPAEHGVYDDGANDGANDATRVSTRVSRPQSSSINRGAIDTYAHNADEINHFVIDRLGACLYAADDNCEVTVVDVAKNERLKTLRFDGHESFVSCVALRGHKPREVVSGGLDARVCVWDRDKASAVRRWSVNELASAADAAEAEASKFSQTENGEEGGANDEAARRTNPSRMMNPPFVHCVATWACARAHAQVATQCTNGGFIIRDGFVRLAASSFAPPSSPFSVCENLDASASAASAAEASSFTLQRLTAEALSRSQTHTRASRPPLTTSRGLCPRSATQDTKLSWPSKRSVLSRSFFATSTTVTSQLSSAAYRHAPKRSITKWLISSALCAYVSIAPRFIELD